MSESTAEAEPPASDAYALASVSGDPAMIPMLYSTGPSDISLSSQRASPREPVAERPGDFMRLTLYETRTHWYLVAHNSSQTRFRMLTIGRVPPLMVDDRTSETVPHDSACTEMAAPAPSTASGEILQSPAEPRSEVPSRARHSRERSMSSVVHSITGGADEPSPRNNAPSGTLSSEITKLASSLAPDTEVSNEPSSAPKPTPTGSSQYLSMYDPEILHLRSTAEWKSYAGEDKEPDLASAPEEPRTVPPISALGTSRSPKQQNRASLVDSTSRTTETSAPPPPTPPSGDTSVSDDAAWELSVTSEHCEFNSDELASKLNELREKARSTGGMKEIGRYFGLIGFVRFTSGYYMVLITRRSVVSLVGGHYLYHCDDTECIPVCHSSVLAAVPGRSKARDQQEAVLLRSFLQMDLSKNFYFSYTYDLTRTLQENMTGPRPGGSVGAWGYNEKYMWNYQLLLPGFDSCREVCADGAAILQRHWVLPLVYGFVDQAKLSILGRTIYVSLIARRSRHFAGARFYKRGIDAAGHVANDVETEQIVNEPVTSPFSAPRGRYDPPELGLRPSPRFTSYVMLRGSIPIYWTQDTTNMSPRPPISISVVDPYYAPAARHFESLFASYGAPIIVLNLVKSKERQPRESKLLHAYTECIAQLKQFLPESEQRLRYIAWDMSRASKSHDEDVIAVLEQLAEDMLRATNFYHSGPLPASFSKLDSDADPAHPSLFLQHGAVRINCVDCLDRTNAAQFVIGKAALAHQLHALGLLRHAQLSFDSDAANMLTEMYHDLGDTIALQYGGSALAHTTDTYRKINQWTSHSRDMLEGIRRYYANSFADADKQTSIDLFLGQREPLQDDTASLTVQSVRPFASLTHAELETNASAREAYLRAFVNSDDGFWEGYYRPSLFTECVFGEMLIQLATAPCIQDDGSTSWRYAQQPIAVA